LRCPLCVETDLVMTTRQNVEIDYCPKCRGVWLDRGELDKIIERSNEEMTPQGAPPQQHRYGEKFRRERGYQDDRGSGHRKKKKGLLSELFDFD